MRVWMALALLAAGCAASPELPAPVVRPGVRAGAILPPAQGETGVEVRTFVMEGGARREVAGATCRLESDGFEGSFRTPARVVVPDSGPAAPVLGFACTDGARQGSGSVRAYLRGERGLGGWPAVGVSVGTGRHSNVGVSVGTIFGGGSWGVRRAVYPEAEIELR